MDTLVPLRLCLITSAILVLTVSAVGDAQQARGPTPQDFRFATDKRSKRIPFTTAAGHIFTQVRINNSEPLWFVLDSGAGDSVVDKRQAAALNLRLEGKEDGSGIGESSVEAGLVKGVSLGLPGLELLDQSLYAAPLDSLEPAAGRPVKGLLGFNFFSRVVVEIDYAAHVIIVYDPVAYRYAGAGESIPLTVEANHAYARAKIVTAQGKTVEGKFLVDTGGARALDFTAPFVRANKLLDGTPRTIQSHVSGIGGQIRLRIGRLKSIQLGSYVVQAPVVGFSEATKGASASSEMDGIIGADLLRRFKVILDYSQKRMILEANASFAESDEFDMSGTRLIAEGPKFTTFKIQRIIANSAAVDSGLREGDIIMSVDGTPAEKLSLERVRQMFKQEGRSFPLRIKRGDAVLETRIKLRRLI